MGKGSRVILKKRFAWIFHRCDKCDQFFAAQDYYKEHIQGSFFSSLLANFRYSLFKRKFCSDCYGKYGDALVKNSRQWKWTGKSAEFQGQEITVTLKQEGERLSGTVGSSAGEVEIEEGKAKDGHVSFQITVGERLIKFSGQQHGDTIKGKIEISEGGTRSAVDWTAKRVFAGRVEGPG